MTNKAEGTNVPLTLLFVYLKYFNLRSETNYTSLVVPGGAVWRQWSQEASPSHRGGLSQRGLLT